MATPSNKDRLIEPPNEPLHSFSIGTFSSLRYWNFRFLFGGTLLMSAGSWIQQVTLGWMMFDMTHSPLLVGTLHGVRAIPFLISSPMSTMDCCGFVGCHKRISFVFEGSSSSFLPRRGRILAKSDLKKARKQKRAYSL